MGVPPQRALLVLYLETVSVGPSEYDGALRYEFGPVGPWCPHLSYYMLLPWSKGTLLHSDLIKFEMLVCVITKDMVCLNLPVDSDVVTAPIRDFDG